VATVSVLSMVAALLWVVIPRGDPSPTSDRGDATTTSYTGPARLIGAAGDIACDPASRFYGQDPPVAGNCHEAATAALLKRANVERVLALGDNQYEAATLAEYRTSYERSWGSLKSITYPVAGNHEYYTRGAAGYFQYFGRVAGKPREGWYSVDVGAWHLIALNSNCNEVGCFAGSDQEKWLREDLNAHPTACTLAFWHAPLFSSGPEAVNRSVRPLWNALYGAGVDVVLNGHNHNYERFAPQSPVGRLDEERGIRQFVVGTGGSNLQGFPNPQPNSEVRIADTFGVLIMSLDANGYDWNFTPEHPDGPRDAGHGSCH
jgi:acid phosphatase type 7